MVLRGSSLFHFLLAGFLILGASAHARGPSTCPTLHHSGKWTGTSPDLSTLSAQVVNHFGDLLEGAGPPRSITLPMRARLLAGRSLSTDDLYESGNLEAAWYRDLTEAVSRFKETLADLDLDCDAGGDLRVANAFHRELARRRGRDVQEKSPRELVEMGLGILVTEVAREAAAFPANVLSRPAHYRFPIYLTWLSQQLRQHPDVFDGAAMEEIRKAAGPGREAWERQDRQARPGAPRDHRGLVRQGREFVEQAAGYLLAEGPRRGREPSTSRSFRHWIVRMNALRYAGEPTRAPARVVQGTGDGTLPAPAQGPHLHGTGDGRDPALDPYLVKTVSYEP